MSKNYLDTNLSIEERVNDLVSQMTLEEKTSQMLHYSPAIERLEIPSYNWWNECLHGVARAGVATVFPQSIGMAASFNEGLLYNVASAVSDEARAKYHEFQRQDDHGIYKGLTFWTPNINIFRDPRWGRGHETYGEDPYLTSRLGVAFIEGLQGDDPKHMKIAACAKHFAVHNGPEADRHSFNALVSPMDLEETYLPAFEAAVLEAKVESVMGAYNRTNDEPCCGSYFLLDQILRKRWNFKGHVVSDCGAIQDFHLHHHVTNSPAESAALAVKAGSDLNCGQTYAYLNAALENGLLSEEDIDRSVTRLFMTRFKLGQFDPQASVSYASIPYEVNDCKAHHVLSYETALQTMVLLKNNGLLPLNRDSIKKIAVVGPNADDKVALLGNYNGTPSVSFTPLEGIKACVNDDTRVFYAKGCEIVNDRTENLAVPKDRIKEAVAAASYSDVTVICVGLNADFEGEEGDTFNSDAGGDKTSLKLTGHQNELIKKVSETGTKVILAVMTGSPMELIDLEPMVDAIIQVWYPGAFGGLALGRLLFGDRDFSARLPMTLVKRTEDLPPFEDYSMDNRTYKFIKTEPLYPFGFGLSYNNYAIKAVDIFETIEKDTTEELTITIKNEGDFDSQLPIQVYITPLHDKYRVPNYKLVNIDNILIPAGDTVTLPLDFDSACVKTVNEDGEYVYDCDEFILYVGFSQPDERSAQLLGSQPFSQKITLK